MARQTRHEGKADEIKVRTGQEILDKADSVIEEGREWIDSKPSVEPVSQSTRAPTPTSSPGSASPAGLLAPKTDEHTGLLADQPVNTYGTSETSL